MSNTTSARMRKPFSLPFHSVRHISCPNDQENNRKVYTGYTRVGSILELATDENVRDYLLDAEGRQRRVPTQVHRAILDTLENNPHNFSVLNSGIVVVARDCEVNEKEKLLLLKRPSIVNGSQTQGVIRDFIARLPQNSEAAKEYEESAFVSFEIIVTNDEDLIAEISIARNFQNDVMTLSIAGRRGQLDELEERIQAKLPDAKLQKSETKLSEDYIKTERLLQVLTALTPKELWPPAKEFNKVFSYSMKAKCLKNFQEIYVKAKSPSDPDHEHFAALYEFYLDVAPQANALYEKWKTHQGFAGTGIRSIEREDREIVEVPDGIIFPILSALSAFAKKQRSGWTIAPPSVFNDEELIKAAKAVYMDIANHNPWNMGKSKSCYSALYQITSIYKRLARNSN